ncbi:MAG TPA: ABC transporter permease [Candidatus Eisenbacteria bacterium]|jgi:predicted permease|nr:ABC transporter permease [Candidatus Eisenbacteria bacterium]
MRNWTADFRFGLRALRRSPGFAIGAILVLALGIGANTAIFSIVNAVLLRPLPYEDPSRLVQVWHVPPAKSFPGITLFSVSPANYLDWQAQSSSFDSMAIYGGRSLTFGGKDQPEMLQASNVAPEFFSVLRARPLLGRMFSREENRPGSNHVILLGYKVWRDRFGADPNIVGRDITLDSQPYSVVGVMPEKFRFPSFAEAWVPLGWTNEERAVRGNHNYLVIARLKSGVDITQAKSELATISTRLEQLYPEDDKGWGATVVPLREQLVGDVRTALLVLLGAVAFVLLIACANVANLVLAKTLARRKEIAIRSSLGASRAAILRNILSETVLLSVIGGVLGFLLARVSLDVSLRLLADHLPSFAEITLDTRVLAFTLLLSVIAGVLAGFIPSLRFSRVDVNAGLKLGQSRGSSDSGGKTRNLLVVSEVALSLVLLVGAGLMVRTLMELRNVSPGFDSSKVLTMDVSVGRTKFPTPAASINFFNEVLQRVRAVPGIESAGVIDSLPLNGGGSHQPFSIEGRPVLPMADQPEVDVRMISPGYLPAMHVPIIRGRDFQDSDAAGRPGAALISESLARRFWPNEDPIGKHLTLTFFPDVVREVVGVVGNVKLDSLDETRPVDAIYVALAQMSVPKGSTFQSFGLTLAARAASDPHGIISAVTDAVHQVGSDVPVLNVLSMDEIIAQSVSPQRFNVLLLSSFAGLALLLAAVGIYGVLSYTVRRRVREIGIRMALGATDSDVLKLIVTDGMKPILLGVVIGLAAALALSRLIASLIFGVRPTDPLTFGAVAFILVAVGILANIVPAYRATRIEPVRTLRDE